MQKASGLKCRGGCDKVTAVFLIFHFMKKIFFAVLAAVSVLLLAACAGGVAPADTTKAPGTTVSTQEAVAPAPEVSTGPIAFADVGMDIMDAMDTYKIFRFTQGEGTCMEQGFPTNLVYAAPNMIKTEDEKYFENMTAVDFTGRISFNELPLSSGSAACEVKTATGVTTAQVTCYVGEGDAKKEVCKASFKLYGEKK